MTSPRSRVSDSAPESHPAKPDDIEPAPLAPPEAVFEKDLDGTITSWSTGAQNVFGFTAEEILGRSVKILAPADRTPEIEQHLGTVRNGQSLSSFVTVRRTKAGRTIPVAVTLLPRRDDTGRVVGSTKIARPLSTVSAPHAEQGTFRKIAAQVPGMLYQFRVRPDGSACLPQVSEGIRDIFGVSPADVVETAQPLFDLIHPEDHDDVKVAIQKFGESLTPWFHEFRIQFPEGRIKWLQGNSLPEREEDGSVLWHGFITDVTSSKLASEKLHDFKAMLDQTRDCVFMFEPETLVFTYVNRGASEQVGYSEEELLKMTPVDIKPEFDREEFNAVLQPLREDPGRSQLFETLHRHKDGHTVPVEIQLQLIQHSPNRAQFVAIVRDLTHQRNSQDQNLRMERKLQEAAKLESMGVMAGGIAHDFNNLLTGILGNVSLARLDLPQTSALQSSLSEIEASAHRAADLCKQMLAYSGRGKFVIQNIDLNDLIEETTHLLNISISKTCVLRFSLHPVLPAVSGDATQLRQIIMNLVINASEAIGDRSGVISLNTGILRMDDHYRETVNAKHLPDGDYVFVEISDNGIGMDKETSEKIFDPFFTTKFTGRGLGLAAVLGIVRSHRGGIKIYTEKGRGTTFKIMLPATPDPTDKLEKGNRDIDPEWRLEGEVLIADDEESVRTVAARLLERVGLKVTLTEDGGEALKLYRVDPDRFDLVLIDLTMPHMDGEETFRRIRHLKRNQKIVLMSGFTEEDASARFAGKGLAGFVQKPFVGGELIDRIREVLESDPDAADLGASI